MKRLIAVLAALVLFGSLSGCSGSFIQGDGILVPPTLTKQQNAIYQALIKQTGKDILLCYPQNGSYRSAFVIRNLDEEPSEEAIVFYQMSLQANRSTQLRVNILDQTADGKWVSACDLSGGGSAIDRIDFGNFSGESFDHLVVGYQNETPGERELIAYRYQDGMLSEEFSRPYEIFSALPFSDTLPDGLFVVGREEEEPSSAELLLWQDGGFRVTDRIPLREEVDGYPAMNIGKLSSRQTALFLDGTIGETFMTQVIVIENEVLGKLSRVSDSVLERSGRTQEVFCEDMNGDGVFEVPVAYPIPGSEAQYYIDWMSCSTAGLTVQATTFVDAASGYYLQVPEAWKNDVSVELIPDQDEVRFYQTDGENEEELLRLRTTQRTETEQNALGQGYIKLMSVGQVSYLARINMESESDYRFGKDELIRRFSTLLGYGGK